MHVLQRFEVWRIFTSLIPAATADAVVSCILLYPFRQFERQMGSRAFTSMLLLVTALAASFQLAALLVLPSLRRLRAGPYAIVFALFAFYYGAPAAARRCRVRAVV